MVTPKHGIEYEKELVANFVPDIGQHGDAAHYTRALNAEIDFNCSLGQSFGASARCYNHLGKRERRWKYPITLSQILCLRWTLKMQIILS